MIPGPTINHSHVQRMTLLAWWGMPGEGHNPERTLGPLRVPPRAGHTSDPVVEETPPPGLSQV